jgi:hypothetical protein
MVTQVNSTSLGAVSSGAVLDINSRARTSDAAASYQPSSLSLPRDSSPSIDRVLELAALREGLTNAVTAIDVALRFGKQAFAELTTGEDRTPAQLAAFAGQLRDADKLSGGLLTGATLVVRTSPEGASIDIEGVNMRALGSNSEGVKSLSAALSRFALASDRLTSHARLAAVTQHGLQGVTPDLDADGARLAALDASQALRGVSPAVANAAATALLALFQA